MSSGGFPRSVLIHGTGLIGSSIALALKKHFPGLPIYGVDSPEVLEKARRIGAVEAGTVERADLIVLATPVGSILKLLDKCSPGGSSLIIDVGSTKLAICHKAQLLGLPFVGGHPMAGSEKAGPDSASAELFEGEPFFLCPISTTPEGAVARLTPIIKAIGAKPIVLDADRHDRLVARISHLPQILSTALADYTAGEKAFAGPGWRSMTRLGSSPFHVWRDILQTSGSLPVELESFITHLRAVVTALEAGNTQEIEAMFDRANGSDTGENHEQGL